MSVALSAIDRLRRGLAARTPETVEDRSRSPAAVAVVLAESPVSLLLIRRAEREGDRWSGQMAFPGGRWSPEDPGLLETARRETREEVGLELADAELLGALDDIAPRTPTLPPVIVRPFVFRLDRPPALRPNYEVAHAAWVGIDRLTDASIYRDYRYPVAGATLVFPGYHLPEGVVWGMTERILTPLLDLIR
ncbi:MAG: CoA pyrophosphatase [Gemmatimonadales bacterium]